MTLAIEKRKNEVASWLIKTDLFSLEKVIENKGFNYFALALV